jgi:hypothetical protein
VLIFKNLCVVGFALLMAELVPDCCGRFALFWAESEKLFSWIRGLSFIWWNGCFAMKIDLVLGSFLLVAIFYCWHVCELYRSFFYASDFKNFRIVTHIYIYI